MQQDDSNSVIDEIHTLQPKIFETTEIVPILFIEVRFGRQPEDINLRSSIQF